AASDDQTQRGWTLSPSLCEETPLVKLDPLDLSCCKPSIQIKNSVEREKCVDQGCQAEPEVCSREVQWDDPWKTVRDDHLYAAPQPRTPSSAMQTDQKPLSEGITEAVCNFYTELSLDGFWKLVTTVSVAIHSSEKMSIGDQVLLTLMRLRLGLLYFDLAIRFSTSVSNAGKVFRTMVFILQGIMSKVVVWLPLETILATMPPQFVASGYSNTTCIIDCTEVQMQRPKKLYPRGQTYSHYRGCNTVKFLVAIAPSGFIMFVSGTYGGRASDKFIVENPGFTEYLYQNQEIMADRGFALSQAMREKGVRLNVPAFSRGRRQFPEAEATVSRRISRIHVERAINCIKAYRILKHSLPIHHKKLMNSIILVCAGLCNLKGPLIAPEQCQDEVTTDEC
ncbi:unnamed protein product, partial [Ixodes hexagonus]